MEYAIVFWGIVAVLLIGFGVVATRDGELGAFVAVSIAFLLPIAAAAFVGIGYLVNGDNPFGGSDESRSSESRSSGGGGVGLSIEQVYGDDVVEAYCAGAVSAAQRRGCLDHVTYDDIVELDTPAARRALAGIPDEAYSDLDP